MEKERIAGWPSSSEMSWEHSMDGNAISELIGRLGTICSGGDGSASSSRYATPLDSPRELHLAVAGDPRPYQLLQLGADAGFAERAARLSCFDGGILEPGKISRVPSSRSMKLGGSQETRSSTPVREESSVSDPNSGSDRNARKRRAPQKAKTTDRTSSVATKMEEEEEPSSKLSRSAKTAEAARELVAKRGGGGQKQGKENNENPPETPKQEYIHVRARRGQATDRHSLAERVRREKISERMKLLQDLVPGCNKIIGKAVMLDEIINYVQSLQRQVQFLSRKLATLNPNSDLSIENLLQKDMHQACGPPLNSVCLLESSVAGFSYPHQPQQGVPFQCIPPGAVGSQCSVNQLGFALPRTLNMQRSSLDGFGDAVSQQGAFVENDQQSFVQMDFGQNQEAALSSQKLHGNMW